MLLRQPKTQLQLLNQSLEENYYPANRKEEQKRHVLVVVALERVMQPELCQEVVVILAVEAERLGVEKR